MKTANRHNAGKKRRDEMPEVPGQVFCSYHQAYHKTDEFAKHPGRKQSIAAWCRRASREASTERNLALINSRNFWNMMAPTNIC
jgi:hypothetical protein